jgi:hypothetical protein
MLFFPIRSEEKRIGPLEVSLIERKISNIKGKSIVNNRREKKISNNLFILIQL